MASAKFAAKQLEKFSEALYVAEESVSDHYRLSAHAWGKYPYEVRTLAQLLPAEIEDTALAQVVRMRQPSRPGRLRGWDFFRICVQDHNILGAVQREAAGELLMPLLTYVLAHELVHVVRFYQFQHMFESGDQARHEEESRVHGITAEVLDRVRLPHLARVINLYRKYGTEDWNPGPLFFNEGIEHADLRVSMPKM